MRVIFIKDYVDFDTDTGTAVFVKEGETGVTVNMEGTSIELDEQGCVIENVDQGAFIEMEDEPELEKFYAGEL